MILKALLVSLVYYVSFYMDKGAGVLNFSRPLVVGPLTGLVLGDLQTGLLLGATFEAVFLGVMSVGGAAPANPTVGAIIGVAAAILTKADASAALSVAVPVALLGVALGSVNKMIMGLLVPLTDKCADEGNIKGYVRLHFIMSFIQPVFLTVVIFIAIAFGVNLISPVLNSIPKFVTTGLSVAGGMMPAVGFAILINMLYNKKLFVFYFLGFVLAIYLKLPSMAIAIIASVIAIAQFFNDDKKTEIVSASNVADSKITIYNKEVGEFLNE